MTYSQYFIQDKKKVPTVFVLLFIALLMVFFFGLFNKSSIPSRATTSGGGVKRVEIANILPHQATIFWQTEKEMTGWVIFGQKGNGSEKSAFDDRDLPNKKNTYLFHSVTLSSLSAGTTYQFKIVGDNAILSHGPPYTLTTPKDYRMSAKNQPAYGKVLKTNNQPLENGTVMLQLKNSYPLISLTKSSGEWLIPLFAIYDKNTLQQRQTTDADVIKIDIFDDPKTATHIDASLSNVSPLPQTIILGSDYNFINKEAVLGAQDKKSGQNVSTTLQILYPQENALIPGYTPILKGTAVQGADLLITIQGNDRTFASRTEADSQGMWDVVMKGSMIIGKYLMTVEESKDGNLIATVKRSFLIVANEGNDAKVLGVASGEPTIIQTKITPTVYQTASTSAKPIAPVTGSNHIMPIVSGVSFVILGLGIMLAF